MGHVDRVDKNIALSRLRLKRCMKRYHRAIFLWYRPVLYTCFHTIFRHAFFMLSSSISMSHIIRYLAVILNNIMVLFDALFSDASELKRSKEAAGIGYKHWFQLELGSILIEHGLEIAREEKIQKAALMVTSFCRLTLAKLRTVSLRVAVQSRVPLCQLQTMRRSVTRCQLQRVAPRVRGRPFKRKRGGGRPVSCISTSIFT